MKRRSESAHPASCSPFDIHAANHIGGRGRLSLAGTKSFCCVVFFFHVMLFFLHDACPVVARRRGIQSDIKREGAGYVNRALQLWDNSLLVDLPFFEWVAAVFSACCPRSDTFGMALHTNNDQVVLVVSFISSVKLQENGTYLLFVKRRYPPLGSLKKMGDIIDINRVIIMNGERNSETKMGNLYSGCLSG
jgi:hypothetical protein